MAFQINYENNEVYTYLSRVEAGRLDLDITGKLDASFHEASSNLHSSIPIADVDAEYSKRPLTDIMNIEDQSKTRTPTAATEDNSLTQTRNSEESLPLAKKSNEKDLTSTTLINEQASQTYPPSPTNPQM